MLGTERGGTDRMTTINPHPLGRKLSGPVTEIPYSQVVQMAAKGWFDKEWGKQRLAFEYQTYLGKIIEEIRQQVKSA